MNKVVTIQDDVGSWLQNKDEIHAVSFFANLYSDEEREYCVYPTSNDFPRMTSNMISSIMQPVNDEEIMRIVFNMHLMKAPGVDGLHAIFYQSQWQVVGPSVCKVVKEVFVGKNIPLELNKTLIVLIPKNNNPANIKMFRPISLCPLMYKIIIKIMTNRLKEVLPHLIGPTQAIFIPRRHITENIVIARENGELTKSFIPSRGIRQGDPISPYIFMLCIDKLRHGINQAVREGRWKPIKLARQVIPITHVFFIDDLLLLVIKDVLNSFCVSFGENVSTSKILTFFSHNVNVVDVKKIREKLEFTTTKDLGPPKHSMFSVAAGA
ncbi:hypothetical protein KPL70_000832 [Citrus sinensis]|nr:hypothetical protein KPL70_000832 [Citrus sinensis]